MRDGVGSRYAKVTIGPHEFESLHATLFSACLLAHGREKLAKAARAITERTEAQIASDESRWSEAADLALAWFEAWQIIERSHQLEGSEDQPLSKAADYRAKALEKQCEVESLWALIRQEFKALRNCLDEIRACFHFAPFALSPCRDGWLTPFERVAAFEPQTHQTDVWDTLIQTLRAELLALQSSRIGIAEVTSQFWLKPKQRSKYAIAIRSVVLPRLDKMVSYLGSISCIEKARDSMIDLCEQRCREIDEWWATERLKVHSLPCDVFARIEGEIRLREELTR